MVLPNPLCRNHKRHIPNSDRSQTEVLVCLLFCLSDIWRVRLIVHSNLPKFVFTNTDTSIPRSERSFLTYSNSLNELTHPVTSSSSSAVIKMVNVSRQRKPLSRSGRKTCFQLCGNTGVEAQYWNLIVIVSRVLLGEEQSRSSHSMYSGLS